MNYNEFNNPIFGVQREDILIEDTTTIDELNNRIQTRHFTDNDLQPYFTPRPTPTKYSRFPMVERRAPVSVAIRQETAHHPSTNFNPATRPYGFGSYLANYEDEARLRQPMIRLQDDRVYLPSSKSDLYHVSVPQCITRNEDQTHPLLFERPHIVGRKLDPFVEDYIGKAPFLNPTVPKLINYKGNKGIPGTI